MPRTSKRMRLLRDLETNIEDVVELAVIEGHNSLAWKTAEDLLEAHEILSSLRYISPREQGAQHDNGMLDRLIYENPEGSFLALFRMQRQSFWVLVDQLKSHWETEDNRSGRGRASRPVYQQLAVGLYVLGGEGGGVERHRVQLNIGHGTVISYLWRCIYALQHLIPTTIVWPDLAARQSWNQRLREDSKEIFHDCIGFLGGTGIILRDRPRVDYQEYFSPKSYYGFNLQAVCGWDRRFIYAYIQHPASVHDSTAFKNSSLYQNRDHQRRFEDHEFLLADKAYPLQRHVITPYKGQAGREKDNITFNNHLSTPRVKIEHAFCILKARWPSLNNLPIRIGEDRIKSHDRAVAWTMACLVLNNLLLDLHEDDSWLEWSTSTGDNTPGVEEPNVNHRELARAEAEQRAGECRREDLKDRLIKSLPQ